MGVYSLKVEGDQQDESDAHAMFDHRRMHGEWFMLDLHMTRWVYTINVGMSRLIALYGKGPIA
jgi:hypothetical protein